MAVHSLDRCLPEPVDWALFYSVLQKGGGVSEPLEPSLAKALLLDNFAHFIGFDHNDNVIFSYLNTRLVLCGAQQPV